jgi:hypothetical protein
MSLLNRAAVGALKGKEATEILQAYLATPGLSMAQTHTLSAAADQPSGKGAGDNLVKPR